MDIDLLYKNYSWGVVLHKQFFVYISKDMKKDNLLFLCNFGFSFIFIRPYISYDYSYHNYVFYIKKLENYIMTRLLSYCPIIILSNLLYKNLRNWNNLCKLWCNCTIRFS